MLPDSCEAGERLVHGSVGVCAEGKIRKVLQDGHGCNGAWAPAGYRPNADPRVDTSVTGGMLCNWPCLSLPGCLHPRPQESQYVPVSVSPPRRHGLSEAELKDVLSLDDEVLEAVYQDWTPPSKELLRFPPLLWVRLRRDLGHCLARRPVDGFTLLAIAHRWVQQGGNAVWVSESEGSPIRLLLVPDPSFIPVPRGTSTLSTAFRGFHTTDSDTTNLFFKMRINSHDIKLINLKGPIQ